nr:MAG TPA: hypothetical protein [Caudoviricetes sp.]
MTRRCPDELRAACAVRLRRRRQMSAGERRSVAHPLHLQPTDDFR